MNTSTSLPPSPSSKPPNPKRRRIIVALAFTLAFVVTAGVVVVILTSRVDPRPSASAPTITTVADVPRLDSPTSLIADPGRFRLLLRWDASAGEVGQYVITRNGEVVASLPRGRTRWLDTEVFPTTRYRYSVRAVDADGVPSAPATTVVRTPGAPPALARVQGLYDVTLITESKYGYSSFPAREDAGWRFVPVCDSGACDVDWRDRFAHELTGRLDLARGTYSGSDSGRFNIECRGTSVMSTVTIRLHVTRAEVVGDTWRATVLEGHVTQREAPQLGCRSSGVDYTARLVLYP